MEKIWRFFLILLQKPINFFQDGKAYITLLNELKNESNYSSQFSLPENEQANKILEDSKALGVPEFVKQDDILRGNELINFLFCSELFLAKHGLLPFENISEDEKKAFSKLISDHHKDDADLKEILPLKPDSNDLINQSSQGVLLWFDIFIIIKLYKKNK